jgi:hypothetical protein
MIFQFENILRTGERKIKKCDVAYYFTQRRKDAKFKNLTNKNLATLRLFAIKKKPFSLYNFDTKF